MRKRFADAIRQANSEFKVIGSGRHRVTFRCDESTVIKLPTDEHAEWLNSLEVRQFERYIANQAAFGVHYALCYGVHYHGVIAVTMEYVEQLPWSHPDMPKWAGSIDCMQVGRAYDGRIVAYDFAPDY